MDLALPCRYCGGAIQPEYYFCPNCGKKLRYKPESLGIGRQMYIYIVSALLPPTGLFWGIKYFLQDDQKTKMVGAAAIVVTLVSLFVNVWFASYILGSLTQSVNGNINQYRSIGL